MSESIPEEIRKTLRIIRREDAYKILKFIKMGIRPEKRGTSNLRVHNIDIVKKVGVSETTVNEILAEMKECGLIRYVDGKESKRPYEITKTGEILLDCIEDLIKKSGTGKAEFK